MNAAVAPKPRYSTGHLFSQSHLRLGWIVAIAFFYEAFIQPSKMGDIEYVYNAADAANYAAFAPICWCIFFSWIILVSYTGNGG